MPHPPEKCRLAGRHPILLRLHGGDADRQQADRLGEEHILRDDDVGSAVMLKTTYSSLMPKALLNFFNATGVTYSGRTVDVMGNIGAQC